MKRTLYNQLLQWKRKNDRKPLILNGARQVGKTYLLQEFGRNEYEKVAFFSLDRNPMAVTVFEQGGSVADILLSLSAISNVDITPGNTLVVLDEVQDCPKALETLKYFCEDAPEYHVVVAGSLLGLSLHDGVSYPVGKVWDSIPAQLAKENKKFIYGAVKKSARAADFELAIQWLIDAGLVYKVMRANSAQMPLKFYEDLNAFKLFMLDVGLMGAMAETSAEAMLVDNSVFTEYKGAFTELYVLTQLKTLEMPIYYHSVDNSTIELDFIVQLGGKVWPVEVKAETNVKAKSMRTFINNHPNLTGIRFSMLPYERQDWIVNIPLYACLMIGKA